MTPEQISALTGRQIEKFLALANSHLLDGEIIPSAASPGRFVLMEKGETGRVIEQLDLVDLIRLSGVPDMPAFWPDHLQAEWPPTYMDEGETLFNEQAYWGVDPPSQIGRAHV